MKYYVMEVTRYIEPVNDRQETFSMNGYEEDRLAKSTFHQKMATAMKNDNVSKEIICVMDDRGVMIINPEVYEKIVAPEPEPTPEPETPTE